MTIRTTQAAVREILAANWDGKSDLAGYIAGASMVVDQAVPWFGKRDRVMRQNYTSAQLELLERYLAAHFYCKSDPLYISKGNMGASGSFQRKTDDGFQLTEYGRAACEMDTTGVLSAIGKRQVAGIAWAGRNRDECYPGDRYGTGSCY